MCIGGRYHNKAFKKIDGYQVVCVDKQITGLLYDILIDSIGSKRRWPGCPRVGVVVGDKVVPVSVSEKPRVLSKYSFPQMGEVLNWVFKHHNALLMHWNHRLSDKEVLEAVSYNGDFED